MRDIRKVWLDGAIVVVSDEDERNLSLSQSISSPKYDHD
jgi:hypothetical protein